MENIKISSLITDKISGEWGDDAVTKDAVNVIRTANFTNSGIISFDKVVKRSINLQKVDKKQLQNGDIIIEKSGGSPSQPVGRVVYFQNPNEEIYLCNNFTSILRPDLNKVSPKYLFYLLFNFYNTEKVLAFQNKTTGIINLKLDRYLDSEISYEPDLKTQNKIVAILDKGISLFKKREESIAKYDELLRATFLEMFGDPVLNTKKWPIKLFGKIAKNENSKRIPIKKSDRDKIDGEYPYYGATGVIDFINDYKFNGDYLLIAEDGKNLLYNKKNNAFLASGKFWVNNHAHVLSDNGIGTIYYLLFFLNLIDLKPYITGSDQIKLNKKNLEQIPVPVPPKELQTKFDSILLKYEILKEKTLKSKEFIETLNNSISQLAFKGELDFNTAVNLEVLLENDYLFFKKNSSIKSIQLLLDRLDKNELNEKKFNEQEIYDKAKAFVFELLKEGKIKQIFDKKTNRVKLTV
ncbi:MAG: type I restriction enzyme S subunit [bacterium]|jgi:type I restriction enzyme S subunit